MGTLASPNLTLLSPDGNDSVPNGAGLNAFTCDRLDTLYGDPGPHTYSPQLTATTNPDVGNGSITGFYFRVIDLVFVNVSIVFGSGMSEGSGGYNISGPFPPIDIPSGLAESPSLGSATLVDSLVGNKQTGVVYLSTTTFGIATEEGAPGRNVTSISPFTWSDGDIISMFWRYRIAVG